MKNLHRRYKISQLLDESLLDKDKEIVEFILDKIKDLTLFIDDYGGHNYMNSKGEWIFQLDADEYLEPDLIYNLEDILNNNVSSR